MRGFAYQRLCAHRETRDMDHVITFTWSCFLFRLQPSLPVFSPWSSFVSVSLCDRCFVSLWSHSETSQAVALVWIVSIPGSEMLDFSAQADLSVWEFVQTKFSLQVFVSLSVWSFNVTSQMSDSVWTLSDISDFADVDGSIQETGKCQSDHCRHHSDSQRQHRRDRTRRNEDDPFLCSAVTLRAADRKQIWAVWSNHSWSRNCFIQEAVWSRHRGRWETVPEVLLALFDAS